MSALWGARVEQCETRHSWSLKSAFKDGALNLDHVVADDQEVEAGGVTDGRVSPMLISMDADERVRERRLTAHDVGNVRESSQRRPKKDEAGVGRSRSLCRPHC